MTKVGLMAGLAVFVCACGGSDSSKPGFNYGAPTTPSGDDADTVNSVSNKLASAIQLQGSATLDPAAAMGMFGTMDLGALFTTSGLRSPFPSGKLSFASASSSDVSFYPSDCVSVTDTTITYSNCSLTYDSESMTINGTVSVSATSVGWNLTMTMDMSTTTSASVNVTASGQYTFTTTSLSGSSSTAMTIDISQGRFGVEVAESVNVTFDGVACGSYITGGSYELAFRWTSVPSAYADQAKDRAYRVTWTGCNSTLISHSL